MGPGHNDPWQEIMPYAPWDERKGLMHPGNPDNPSRNQGFLRDFFPTIRQFGPSSTAPNYSMGRIKPEGGPISPEEEQGAIVNPRNQEEQQKMAIFELLRKLLQQRRQI